MTMRTKPTPSGRRDRRVTLRRPDDPPTRNDDNEVVETYSDVMTCWASIEPVRGSESVQANQPQGELQYLIKLPWCRLLAQLDGTWRVRDKRTLREFGITAARNIDDGLNEWWLDCVIAEGSAAYPTVLLDAVGEPLRDASGDLLTGAV